VRRRPDWDGVHNHEPGAARVFDAIAADFVAMSF
jgi:hypothetical protein